MKTKRHFQKWCLRGWVILVFTIIFSSVTVNSKEISENNSRQVEALDRGIVAVKTNDGILISWRVLGIESDETNYKLYRDDELIYESCDGAATCYLDPEGTTESIYQVITEGEQDSKEVTAYESNYFDIPINKPENGITPDGKEYFYLPGDCSCGDLDGDGEYEIILKWDSSNATDNSQEGYTGNVILDAYKLDGTQLWRIDLGVNIRAGAHYTQFIVYDFDGDGKAEMICKTADGSVDGGGNAIGEADADYRNESGYILDGPEYLTVFNGENGEAITTVEYEPGRGNVADWGDDYGNRVDRFLACVAYLDGETPSVVMCRGYYTRVVLVAYSFDGKNLTKLWTFDSDEKGNASYARQGNHNLCVADVDQDGYDEIVYGQCCIDQDGSGLWTTCQGHGDAVHVGDFLPDREGLEVWGCLEDEYAVYLADAATGEILEKYPSEYDVGRALADNFIPGNDTAEFAYRTTDGTFFMETLGKIDEDVWPNDVNFSVWFTDRLERCALDDTLVYSFEYGEVLNGEDVSSCNKEKSTPCLTADLLGDWREEIIFAGQTGDFLRVYLTDSVTDYRIYTLMHNSMYRCGVADENVGYNIPPHTNYYLDSNAPLPDYPDVYTR